MFSFFSRPQADTAPTEELLKKAVSIPDADKAASMRVWRKISNQIEAPMFAPVRAALTPSKEIQSSLWNSIRTRLDTVSSNVWSDVREGAKPSETMVDLVWQRVVMRLVPAPAPTRRLSPILRWSASALALALFIQISPLIFLPQSVASSQVLLSKKIGKVSILMNGLWNEVPAQVSINQSALIQTGEDSEATIVLHDHAVLRLGENTTIALHDIRNAREGEPYDPTMTFYNGKFWVQSFVTDALPTLSVGTDAGKVQMHEGSISLVQAVESDTVELRVWNRRVTVERANETVSMFAGDEVTLVPDTFASVQKFGDPSKDDPWMRKNLQLDAIHQREVAALQKQRMVEKAGTLPTSFAYPIKRLAEEVDVLLTVGNEAKAQKRLDQASVRLSEAAALSEQGDALAASAPLEEYKQTVLSIASGTGETVVKALIQQQIAEDNAGLSAVLPDDQLYAIKEIVVETSDAISDATVTLEEDAAPVVDQGRLLQDKITSLQEVMNKPGFDTTASRTTYTALMDEFRGLLMEPGALTANEQTDIPATLHSIDLAITQEEAKYARPAEPSLVLTSDQVDSYVIRIITRILVYRDPRSQFNQLTLELQALAGHPEEGRILRRLRQKITSDQLKNRITLAIDEIREDLQK